MLKTIDVLVGAVTVLPLFSMAVTVITQAITTMAARRGKHLKSGLADLLQVVTKFEVGDRVQGNGYWYADAHGDSPWAGSTNIPDPTRMAEWRTLCRT
jgi:hypothetical protein